MKPALLVATKEWDPESWADRIRALLPDRTVLTTDRNSLFTGQSDALDTVHYALVWKPTQEMLDRLANLRVIFSLGAGVDHVLRLPRLPEVPIARIVDPDLSARMTEYVVWQVLDHLRHGQAFRRQQQHHVWREPHLHPTAHDITVGIMGLGAMGMSAVDALLRFGFVVRGWSRTPKTITDVETFAGDEGLEPFLSGTDVLVSLLPLTPETKSLVDLKLLRRLRRTGPLGGAVLITAGRGGSQVETDIATALRDGTLAGASLDVFEEEPLAADSPLWDLDNVTITPHVAAVSDPEALAIQIVRQIEAFERGEPLRNRVDPKRGY
jgi:glyoxylate/hydroxypyruvate reductase A